MGDGVSTQDIMVDGAITRRYREQERHPWCPTSVSELEFTMDDPVIQNWTGP